MASRSAHSEALLDDAINNGVDNENLKQEGTDNALLPIIASCIAAMGAIGFGYSLGFTSPALPAMEGDVLQITCNSKGIVSSEAQWFGAIVNIGAMLGAILGGFLANKLGRKGTILLAAVPYAIGWAWMTFATAFWMLLTTRILCGLSVGMCSVSVPLYIAEIAPSRLRGALGTLNQFGVVVGITLVNFVGAELPQISNADRWGPSPIQPNSTVVRYCSGTAQTIGDDWKVLAWIGCGLAVGQLVLMSLMPRTPRWLVGQNKDDEALQSLRKLRGGDYDHRSELEELYVNANEDEGEGTYADLFKPGTRQPLLIAMVMMIIQQCSGVNGVIFYASTIFESAGVKDGNMSSLILQGVQLFFTGVAVFLMDRAGRKVLLLLAATGMAFFSGTLGVFFYLNPHINEGSSDAPIEFSWLALVSLMGYIIFFSIGMGAIPWILMGEIFSSKVSGKAAGLATCLNWTCSFIVTFAFPVLLNASKPFSFWGFSGVCLLGVLFVQFQVFETQGRTLEEIETIFKQKAGILTGHPL